MAKKRAKPARRKSPARKKSAPKRPGAARRSVAKKSASPKKRPRKAPTAAATTRVAAAKPKRPRRTAAQRARGPAEGIAPYHPKRGEPYMSEPQREHFRVILLAWKRELMEEVDRTVHHMRDEASNFPDPNDRASQESEFSLELRTRDRERKLLRKIDGALKRLELNEYGWCESCGAEIGIRRLEARPTATLCIDCKTLDEIRERQKRG